MELEELDKKILEIRKEKFTKPQKSSEVWFKVKIEHEDDYYEEIEELDSSNCQESLEITKMDFDEDIPVETVVKGEFDEKVRKN